jgi:hypothetical protein
VKGKDLNDQEHLIHQAELLVHRLERISPDSIWAHRSSGHRGALLRWLEKFESHPKPGKNRALIEGGDLQRLASLVQASFDVLEKAAKDYYQQR